MTNDIWNNRTVLITGAAGFVGRWLARSLATTGANLVLTDISTPDPDAIFIEPPTNDAEGFALDLTDTDATRHAIARTRPRIIFHLAGQAGVAASHDDPTAAFHANVTATQSILDAARSFNDHNPAHLTALVHASSNHVYGPQAATPTPESAPLNGTCVYAATKACSDILARTYADAFGIPATVARITNSFGGDDPHGAHLITYAINCALNNETPIIKASGRDAKAFIHIDDTVRGLIALAERTTDEPELAGLAFNLVPDEPVTVIELVRKVLRVAGRPDIDPVVADPNADATHEHLDNTDAKKLLDWHPHLSLEEGIEEAITWYRARLARAA